MQVFVIGEELFFEELARKAHPDWELTRLDNPYDYPSGKEADLVFDFTAGDSIDNVIELIENIPARMYLLNTVKTSLHEIAYLLDGLPENVVGFNGLPGFIDQETWEVTTLNSNVLSEFPFHHIRVDDRIGMVTPRVIAMIINEAYYTVQEGTASREDIDMGMKLGTGYPYGPFEWAERIGINHVYELLEALYTATQEERYKICPLLRKEYLMV